MNSKQSFLSICFGVVVFFFGTLSVFAQADELILIELPNGFKGTFKTGNQTLKVDSSADADKSFETRITNSEGQLLAAARYVDNFVTVTVAGVSMRFRKDSSGRGPVEGFSQADQEKLATFAKSNESATLRKMVNEIIKRRTANGSADLKGFLIISLMLGDGPGFPLATVKVQNNNRNFRCRYPKATIVLASYSSPLPMFFAESARKGTSFICNESNCCGCCGVGCLGCSGCYTSACYQHDLCVDLYGHQRA